jgi:magnesium-transporting ATPase (P-type)
LDFAVCLRPLTSFAVDFAFGISTVYKGKAAQTVAFTVLIFVAFVPEGLLSMVMLQLSIAAKQMAAQNMLVAVKELQGVIGQDDQITDDFQKTYDDANNVGFVSIFDRIHRN